MRRAGWFLSVSVGEESDFLEWVPVHDAALADKVAVLTTRRVDGFFPEDYAEAGLFIQKLAAQMPALVHFILKEGGGL